jgi:hypothetical protein
MHDVHRRITGLSVNACERHAGELMAAGSIAAVRRIVDHAALSASETGDA